MRNLVYTKQLHWQQGGTHELESNDIGITHHVPSAIHVRIHPVNALEARKSTALTVITRLIRGSLNRRLELWKYGTFLVTMSYYCRSSGLVPRATRR